MPVVNVYRDEFDVYIGRKHPTFGKGSKFANPYHIGVDGPRKIVLRKYKRWLWDQIRAGEITVAELRALDGLRLGCFCKPENCHGDILLDAVAWAISAEEFLL